MKKYIFAVVGALGNVGEEVLKILENSNLPIKNLVLMDVGKNVGKKIVWRKQEYKVIESTQNAFIGVDLAILSAGSEASKKISPKAVDLGCVIIDNSTAYRMSAEHPLIIPEVNANELSNHRGIIANPNCSTIQMLVVLCPIHKKYNIERVVVSTYQAVSGSGITGTNELKKQINDFLDEKEIVPSVFPHQIALNIIPHIDLFLENGYSKEEMKMILETGKILDPNIKITATTVRVPVIKSHSESLNIQTKKKFEINEIKELLRNSPGIEIEDNPEEHIYPTPLNSSGKNSVFVGRIRRDFSTSNSMNLWCVSDNLRKGAALNAVQIAEELINRNLVRVP